MKNFKLINIVDDTITVFVFDNDYSFYNKVLKLNLSYLERQTAIFAEHEDLNELATHNQEIDDNDEEGQYRQVILYPYNCLMQRLEMSIARMN